MLPAYWTPDHVAVRLVEAFEILDVVPSGHGHQRIRSLLGDMVAPAPVRRFKASPTQVTLMETVLQWPGKYLQEFAALSQLTQRCALLQARGLSMEDAAMRMKLRADHLSEEFEAGCAIVGSGLRQHNVPVF
jgi:hypothetical protein